MMSRYKHSIHERTELSSPHIEYVQPDVRLLIEGKRYDRLGIERIRVILMKHKIRRSGCDLLDIGDFGEIECIHRTTIGSRHQCPCRIVKNQIGYGYVGKTGAEKPPDRADVRRKEDADVTGNIQGPGIVWIDDDIVDGGLGKVAGYILPGSAGVRGAEDMGQVIVLAIAGERHVRRSAVVRVDRNTGDPSDRQVPGNPIPFFPIVESHPDIAVIRARIDDIRVRRR